MLNPIFGAASAATNAQATPNAEPPYLFYAVLIGLLVMMFLSQRKRKKAAEEVKSKVVAGAHVMLTSGIYGQIESIEDDRVTLNLGSTSVVVARGAVARVVEAPVAAPKKKAAPKKAAGK